MAKPPAGQNGSKKDFCLLLVFLKVGPPAGHVNSASKSDKPRRECKNDKPPAGQVKSIAARRAISPTGTPIPLPAQQ